MTKIKSIKFNFFMNSILTASSIIFPLITFPYVSRILLPAGVGKVSFATSIATYFAMFAQLGIPTYGIRATAKVRDDEEQLSRTVQEILIINLVMCIIVYVAFFIALAMVPRLREDRTLLIIVSLTIIFNTVGVDWLYKGLEQYTYITFRSLLFKFIALVAMFFLVKEKNDYIIYGGVTVLASVGSNIFNFINLRKHINIYPVGQYNFKRHFKAIGLFFATSIATTVYTNLDTVMLGFLKTDEDVGYYNAAVKIKNLLIGFVTSLGTVLLPRTSYYIEKGMREEFEALTQKSLNFVILLAFPIAVYFIIFAKHGILLLAGNAYMGSVIPMQIIIPSIIFIGLTNISSLQILVPLEKERIILYSGITGAIINIVINTILIPKFASSGAAIGTLIAEIIVFIIQFFALKDIVFPILKKIHFFKLIFSIAFSSLLSFWVGNLNLPTILILIISACIFFGVYGLLLNIFKEPLVIELENHLFGTFFKKIPK